MRRIKELNLKTVLGIVLFAALMTWLLFRVSAATPFASLEPESASLSSGATVASDSSATGGSFIEFNTANTGGGGGAPTEPSLAGIGPQESITCPSGSVAINPGDNIQSKVDANPTGTTFCLKAGTHTGQHVVPEANNSFIGEYGAVMSGNNSVPQAFTGGGGDDVLIKNLIIENYAAPLGKGTIEGINESWGWNIENIEVRDGRGGGTQASNYWTIKDSYIHHMGQIGITGAGAHITYEHNEVAYNNVDRIDPNWEGGGSKFVWSNQLIARDNYIHDNYGGGLWTDGHNTDTLYEGNTIEDNSGPGIFEEISCNAVIRNNTVKRNGFGMPGWVDGAGILVNDSPNVEIYGNTVIDNHDGIAATQSEREETAGNCDAITQGTISLRNLWVHDNYIKMIEGQSGIAGGPVLDSNRFDRNTYKLDPSATEEYYRWGSTFMNATEWRAAGHDTNGTWE